MTEPFAEASDGDLAEQTIPVGDGGDEADPFNDQLITSAEADIADVVEQRRAVPSDDDDYDRT